MIGNTQMYGIIKNNKLDLPSIELPFEQSNSSVYKESNQFI